MNTEENKCPELQGEESKEYTATLFRRGRKVFDLTITSSRKVHLESADEKCKNLYKEGDGEAKIKNTFEVSKIIREIQITSKDGKKKRVFVRGPIIIPGIKINTHTPNIEVLPGKCPRKILSDDRDLLAHFSNKQLPQPLVTSRFIHDRNELEVDLALLLRTKKGGKIKPKKHIDFYYNLDFDSEGGNFLNEDRVYKLLIYTEFDTGEEPRKFKPNDDFFLHTYKIIFRKQSLQNLSGRLIRLRDVNRIKAMVVSQNPETSRGTETTVQEGG